MVGGTRKLNVLSIDDMPNGNGATGLTLLWWRGPLDSQASHRISPYAELLFGGRKVTYEIDNLSLRKQLMKDWNDGKGPLKHYPKRSDWSVEVSKKRHEHRRRRRR